MLFSSGALLELFWFSSCALLLGLVLSDGVWCCLVLFWFSSGAV
jgi:hypothetical protein